MKLSHLRKKHIYTELGEQSVTVNYLGWNCLIQAQDSSKFKVNITVFNYDENGNKTSGCLAGQLIHLESVAELKDLVVYYLDRVELSCDEVLELVENYAEVMTLDELLD
ncbi:MAG: hypothetical protein HRU38_14800 [Saccharospirillaceae bacterium]|nr:hypothetical protein [Pseudomonadales bacterium]NRB79910.1 hypothetical protein [Saccharospirillaceae bacterium]